MSERPRQIYAVDFDGTLAKTDWPDIIGENTEVIEFVRRLMARGDQWILWTNREGEHLGEALAWLDERGLVPDAVNDNLTELKRQFGNNPRKPFANFYIDDHNAGGLRLPSDEETAPGAVKEKKEEQLDTISLFDISQSITKLADMIE